MAVVVSPHELGWKGALTVQNRTDQAWDNVVAAVCLLLPATHVFNDPQWEHTYFRSGGQYLSYRNSERDGGEPVYQMSLVHGREQMIRTERHIKKWGFTRQPSDDGVIAVTGKGTDCVLVST